jgi:hypothetical protein
LTAKFAGPRRTWNDHRQIRTAAGPNADAIALYSDAVIAIEHYEFSTSVIAFCDDGMLIWQFFSVRSPMITRTIGAARHVKPR